MSDLKETAAAIVPPVATSEKLQQLEATAAGLFARYITLVYGSPEMNEMDKLRLENQKAIGAEKIAIAAAAAEREKAEKRSAIVAGVDAHLADIVAGSAKGATDEQKAAAAAARESIVNAFVGSRPAVATSKAAKAEGVSVPRGTINTKVVARYQELAAAGMSKKDAMAVLVSEGFNDGTAGNAVNGYLKSIGQF